MPHKVGVALRAIERTNECGWREQQNGSQKNLANRKTSNKDIQIKRDTVCIPSGGIL